MENKITGLSPNQAFADVKGLTALRIAEKRQNTSPEWLAIFHKLVNKVVRDTAAARTETVEEIYEDAVEHQG